MKQSLMSGFLVLAASAVSSQGLKLPDPVSAQIFLELDSVEQLTGRIGPLVSVPGNAFRVVDGDVLSLGNLRIRLVGIEAPETAQRCKTADGGYWECSAEAEDRARHVMHSAERVECFSNEQDSYGYHLATCKADGRDIGAVLVGEGLAWPKPDQGYYQAELALAQAGQTGIWQAETLPPWEWRNEQN